MADSDKKRKPGKGRGGGKGGKNGKSKDRVKGRGADDDSQGNLISALNHKLRRQVLRRLNASDLPLSPVKLARALGVSVTKLSYHVNVLEKCDAAGMVEVQQVRGAVEHFYVSKVADHPGVRAMLEATEVGDEGQSRR